MTATTIKIREQVLEAIALLEKAQSGKKPMGERQAARGEAGRILESLPKNWTRHVNDEISALLTAVA